MSRNQSLIRALKLMERLRTLQRVPPIVILARELNVTPRTVFRDLNALEEAGIKLPKRYNPNY